MLSDYIRTIYDRPKPGIAFKDITPLLQDARAFQDCAQQFFARYHGKNLTAIVGIESRGFIFGAMLAEMLWVGFIPIRKAGKLPAETEKIDYALEYGTATIEIHKDALKAGDRVVLMDDLIATGGSALAACELIERLGAEVVEVASVIDLKFLGGSANLRSSGYEVFSLLVYEE